MGTPHKHAAIIKAWADGKDIEFLDRLSQEPKWRAATCPSWSLDTEYRVKPEAKPDTVSYYNAAYTNAFVRRTAKYHEDILKLTFDGETGKLKSAEVLK